MRARRVPRSLAVLVSLTLLATVVAVAPAQAANTRDVYFGSPPANVSTCDATTAYCPLGLSLTTISRGSAIGGFTYVDVIVANQGPQTLSHVAVMGGALADATAGLNTLFPPPSGTSLPSGASFLAWYPSSIPCVISTYPSTSSTANNSLDCAIGQMASGASVQFRIVIAVPASYAPVPPSTVSSLPVWLMTNLNEGSSTTGANQDTFYATGTIPVDAAGCGLVADFFPQGQGIGLVNQLSGQAACPQVTQIAGLSQAQGIFASAGADTAQADQKCLPGFKCFGYTSTATVGTGDPVPGGVTWTITWPEGVAPKSGPKGVIHFLGDGTTSSLSFKPAYQCPSTITSTDEHYLCWLSGPVKNADGSWTVSVFSPSNGGIRGW
jgi:hypothetical protein